MYEATENTLKGKELSLPKEEYFFDSDVNKRYEMRYKWWENLSEMTYEEIKMHPITNLPKGTIELSEIKEKDFYKKDDKSVFFGHYWLKVIDEPQKRPTLFRNNICCLDYSVAEDGHLVAYSFDNELELNEQNLTWVKRKEKSINQSITNKL